MGNVNALLSERLNKSKKSSKMAEMAKQSAMGNRTGFSGIFSVTELNEHEKELLETILHEYSTNDENISQDLHSLISITSEVKAINNQAVILHGERIKKAQQVLKNYREGAFSSWLVAAYGNRQTPYNFLQYYEFYCALPKGLHPQIESMPRQAIYTLASREGDLKKKQELVEKYNGETKTEVMNMIRDIFPLPTHDKRKENVGEAAIRSMTRLSSLIKSQRAAITKSQKKVLFQLLDELYDLVESCKTR